MAWTPLTALAPVALNKLPVHPASQPSAPGVIKAFRTFAGSFWSANGRTTS
jgi:hypothetical protein